MVSGRPLPRPERLLEQIALWTIVRLRSPLVAEVLEKHPEGVELARELADRPKEPAGPPVELARLEQLLADAPIRSLLAGDSGLPALAPDTLALISSVG